MTPTGQRPERMLTFDETEGVLFAGDGFGCFGTLDGGFLDTRINLDRYWDEMVRYYSNIVGKYGSPVQKALAKLGGLPISTICSTHGPVWTETMINAKGKEICAIVKLKTRLNGHKATITEDYQRLKGIVMEKRSEEKLDKWIRDKQKHTYVRINEKWQKCDFKYPGWVKK